MFIEKILEGLAWGTFIVAVMIPVITFSAIWAWLGPRLRKRRKPEEEFLPELIEEPEEHLDIEPELPDIEMEPSSKPTAYRFVASTIVRPPKVVRLVNEEDKDD